MNSKITDLGFKPHLSDLKSLKRASHFEQNFTHKEQKRKRLKPISQRELNEKKMRVSSNDL